MTRTIQDHDLQLWEAFASTGEFGYPDRANMVFHCLTDPGRRARILEREGARPDVEREVTSLSDAELTELLGRTVELK